MTSARCSWNCGPTRSSVIELSATAAGRNSGSYWQRCRLRDSDGEAGCRRVVGPQRHDVDGHSVGCSKHLREGRIRDGDPGGGLALGFSQRFSLVRLGRNRQ